MKGLASLLAEHPFFRGMDPDHVELIAGCAKNARFADGDYLFREGQDADEFHLLREGKVALELHAPGQGELRIQTVKEGDIVGFSWLMPPHRWMFDARALEPTRTLAFDGQCLRGKCEQDPAMGYELLKRVSATLAERLESARLQIMDVYGRGDERR